MIESFRSRRFGGMLCVAVLHVGAVWWIASATQRRMPAPSLTLPSHEIIVRFFTPLPKRTDPVAERPVHPRAAGLAMLRPRTMAALDPQGARALPSATNRSDSAEAAPAQSAVVEVAAPAIIDSEDVKKVIAGMVAEERSKGIASGAAFTPQGSAAQRALGRALRPKCENGEPAKAGNVQLAGLMKLPALMLGAVSDKGCRW